jgi:hypothetical protein
MFFVDELMKNDEKFEEVLQKANLTSNIKSSSESEDKLNEKSLKF